MNYLKMLCRVRLYVARAKAARFYQNRDMMAFYLNHAANERKLIMKLYPMGNK